MRNGQRDRESAEAARTVAATATISLAGARVEASCAREAEQRAEANAEAAMAQSAAEAESAREAQILLLAEMAARRVAHEKEQAVTTGLLNASEAKSVSDMRRTTSG